MFEKKTCYPPLHEFYMNNQKTTTVISWFGVTANIAVKNTNTFRQWSLMNTAFMFMRYPWCNVSSVR